MATESGGWETIVPSGQPAAKADTGGWETISKDVPSNKDIKTTALGTAGRSALETGATIPGMMYGSGVGARLGIAAMPFSGPLAPAMPLIGGVAGGLVAGVAQSMGINSLEQFADTVFGTNIVATKQAQAEQHPIAEKVGSLAGMVAGPGGAFANLSKIGTKEGLKTAATGAGMMVGIGGATRAVQGQDVFDTKEMLTDIAAGSLTGPSKLGEKLIAKGRGAPSSIKPPEASKPTKPPEGATPEEKAAWLNTIKAEVVKRDAESPLVEAAIRNKETGNIERMGPKHDQARKEATADTHEQGFVTERGQFLTREQAVEHAKNTGQIPKDHVLENPPGEQSGLHSGDLRKAGDKRFEITDEQPAGIAKPPVEDTAPKSREDFKSATTKNEDQRLRLEIELDKAARESGNEQRVTEINAEIAKLEAEHVQLVKDMPEVQFKDKTAPTHEEWHDHVWGSKTLGEAIDKTLAVKGLGGLGQRMLMKVLRESSFISNAELKLTKDILKYKDKSGKDKNASGLYYGGSEHRVELGKGSSVTELLHEAMHAGTQKLLLDKTSPAAIEMHRLFDKYQQEHITKYEEALERFKEDNPKATLEDLNKFKEDNNPYGFENVDEFVAEAFTDKDFQRLLSGIDVRERTGGVLSNMWDSFKEVVRLNLGVPNTARSAFDDVIELGSTLVEESKAFKRDANGTIVLSPSRLSKEVHDELEREGIPIAHTSPHKFGMFDWVKHALSGEGANVFGAGTYGSQKDSTNTYYIGMAKQKALDKYLELPEGKVDKIKLDALKYESFDAAEKVGDINYELERAVQQLEGLKDQLVGPEGAPQKEWAKRKIQEQEAKVEQLEEDLLVAKEESYKKDYEVEATVEELTQKIKVPTYHSSIKASSEELLDWNSAQQSELVTNAFKNLGIESANNIDKTTELKINQALKDGWYGNLEEDGSVGLTVLGRDYAVEINDMEFLLDGTPKINSLVVRGTGEIVTSFEQAKKSVLEMIYQDQGYTKKTGEQLYEELSVKLKPTDAVTRNLITDREAKQIGMAKASIALAEQGVVGNVHNAQGGTEKQFRNYVVFDDSRITQNFVVLASRERKTIPSSTGEPVEVDRTKTDPRDVKDEAEFKEIATDIYEKYGETDAVKFYEGYQEYKKTWLEPVKETEKFVGTNIKNKLANDRIIHNTMDKMMESIPDAARREAIAIAIDKGDLSGLSPEEVTIAKKYEALAKDIGDRAVKAGVVKGLLEDYVTHILDWAGAPKGAREEFIQTLLGTAPRDPAMRGMTTESKFGKERKFKTFADLEWFINEANTRIAAAGKSDFRLKIKTKDIAEIYKEYATSMEKAIENKKLVDNLKQVRNVAGETLIKEVNKDNPMPYGWEMMDSPQFAGYAVHPDMMPALKFVFDAGPGDLMKAFGSISQLTKRINVIGSFFHAKSLMEVLSSSQIPLWTPVKEAIVLPLVEKGVKALTGKELQLSAITKAVNQFKAGGVGDNVDMWIKEGGLQLEMPEDVSAGILSATGKFADSMIGKYGPKTRVLEKSLSTVEKYTLGLFDNYTWNFLHTGGKIMVADAYLDKARMTAAKEGKPFDETASRKEISKFVNDSFGGLNWFDAATQTQNEFAKRIAMAAYSPEGRRGLQVALFAPDWTLSTLRAFTAALPKELNPTKWHPVEGVKGMMTPTTKADYARLYQFKTALTYFTLLNAINMMTANRPIWENKDPTRIEWPDGTSMQAMKHAMEPYHWLMDADKTFANKLGFIPKAVIVGVAGTEYASPQAQKLVDLSATGRLKAVAGMVVPFQVAAARDAPPGEGVKRAALGTMGFPIYGSTKEQKKASRAEREKQLKEAAKKYHIKAKEKGWEK